MGIRRQVYLEENDDRLLEEQSRRTGLSVSELVRRAVQQCYGQGARLSWAEVFARSVRVNSAKDDPWVYDPLFDDELLDAELDQSPVADQ
jgi:hypothetical protein